MDQFANAAAAIQASVDQNNAWSAQQAQKQMDFQREMSNTAHQREIADLKAAGLNPVLSAKLGGASTPSGAMATGDTSGTSALVDLLQTAMETANNAASAAASSASTGGSRRGSSPQDNSAKGLFHTPEGEVGISNESIEDIAKSMPRGVLRTVLMLYSSISNALGNPGITIGNANDSGLSSRYGHLKAEQQTDSGSSTGAKQVLPSIVASAKDSLKSLGKDLKKIYAPASQWSSVSYSGDGKPKGSSIYHAGGGSSKRVSTTR